MYHEPTDPKKLQLKVDDKHVILTVRGLIAQLKKMPQNAPVCMWAGRYWCYFTVGHVRSARLQERACPGDRGSVLYKPGKVPCSPGKVIKVVILNVGESEPGMDDYVDDDGGA
jgi:hypothetical protein